MTNIVSNGKMLRADTRQSATISEDTLRSENVNKLCSVNISLSEDYAFVNRSFIGRDDSIVAVGVAGTANSHNCLVKHFSSSKDRPNPTTLKDLARFHDGAILGVSVSICGITAKGNTIILSYNNDVPGSHLYWHASGIVAGIGSGYGKVRNLETTLSRDAPNDLDMQFFLGSVLDDSSSISYHQYTNESGKISRIVKPSKAEAARHAKKLLEYLNNHKCIKRNMCDLE